MPPKVGIKIYTFARECVSFVVTTQLELCLHQTPIGANAACRVLSRNWLAGRQSKI